jgi:arabinogalactan endo-1,4-beta-galactosidase
MAGRAKAVGAKLLLDLHYSDTWADPGHQETPAAWAAFGIDTLEQQVETYTAGVITRLKQLGALPDIVQIGNEIDGGMLWPLGQVSGAGNDTPAQWDHFTRLLKAGIRGVRGALGPGDSVRIMLSYYPWWHGALGQLQANVRTTAPA